MVWCDKVSIDIFYNLTIFIFIFITLIFKSFSLSKILEDIMVFTCTIDRFDNIDKIRFYWRTGTSFF